MAFRAVTLAAMLGAATPAVAGETPKYGDSLIFMIPADAPPSFDAHREGTFATVHSAERERCAVCGHPRCQERC